MLIRNNQITPRQIVVVVAGIILMYLGIPNIISALTIVNVHMGNSFTKSSVLFSSISPTITLGLAFIIIGVVLLFKSKLFRIIFQK